MIYFLQDSSSHAIKIGTANDPEGRAATLQTGNAAKLVLLLEMPGDRALESELHRQFATARIAGEWFHPTSELLAFVLRVARNDGYRCGASDQSPEVGDPFLVHERNYALWRVEGEEGGDSWGGEFQLYAITDDETTPPDAAAAHKAIAASNVTLSVIHVVRLVNTFDRQSTYHDQIHDQRRPHIVAPRALGL